MSPSVLISVSDMYPLSIRITSTDREKLLSLDTVSSLDKGSDVLSISFVGL